MKIAVKNQVIALALTIASSQFAPLHAQSLSDAVGIQAHTFVASLQEPARDTGAQGDRHSGHRMSLAKHNAKSHMTKLTPAKLQSHDTNLAADNTATSLGANTTAVQISEVKPKVKAPLTAKQIMIAKHHAKMLALRYARLHHTALTGFDQVGAAKPVVDIDSLTRDGSSTASAASTTSAHDMSIGSTIARFVAALALVLAMAYGALQVMKKRGIGVNAAGTVTASTGPALKMDSNNPTSIEQFQKAIQDAQARQTTETPFANGYDMVNKTIDGLEMLGRQELPGTAFTLYKVKVGDRILLLGGSLAGALTALTEWDVETKPETEQQFENVLSQMTMSVSPQVTTAASNPISAPMPVSSGAQAGGSQADALRTATQRLSRSARRMAEIGRVANES